MTKHTLTLETKAGGTLETKEIKADTLIDFNDKVRPWLDDIEFHPGDIIKLGKEEE